MARTTLIALLVLAAGGKAPVARGGSASAGGGRSVALSTSGARPSTSEPASIAARSRRERGARSAEHTELERRAAAPGAQDAEALADEILAALASDRVLSLGELQSLVLRSRELSGQGLSLERLTECFDALATAAREHPAQWPYVERFRAGALVAGGWIDAAEQRIGEVLTDERLTGWWRFQLRDLRVKLLRSLGQWQEALDELSRQLEEAEATRERWTSVTRTSTARWFEIVGESHGARAQLYVHLGLLDLASGELRAMRGGLDEVAAGASRLSEGLDEAAEDQRAGLEAAIADYRSVEAGMRLRWRIYSAEWAVACERFSKALEFCAADEELEAAAPDIRSLVDVKRAIALAELAREELCTLDSRELGAGPVDGGSHGSRSGPAARETERWGEAVRALGAIASDETLPLQRRLVTSALLADLELLVDRRVEASAVLTRAFGWTDGVEIVDADLELARLQVQRAALLLATPESEIGDPEAVVKALDDERSALTERYSALLESWDRVPRRSGGVGFLQAPDRTEVLSSWLRIESRLAESMARSTAKRDRASIERAGIESVLDAWLRAESRSTLVRDLEAPAVSLETVKARLLQEGQGILLYLAGKNRSHLVLLDRQGVEQHELPAPDRFKRPSRAMSRLLATHPASFGGAEDRRELARDLHEASSELSELLLPREARVRMAEWRAVSVVGLSALSSVPSACLVFDGRQLLGQRFALDELPSMTIGVHLASESAAEAPPSAGTGREDSIGLLLIADLAPPATGGIAKSWTPIDVPEVRLAALLAPFERRGFERLQGDQVRAATLAQLDFSRARVTNFLLHGAYDGSRERGAALVVRDGGAGQDVRASLWTADQIERGTASPCVVLSACGTAKGPARIGDDHLTHLGGAFLRAGARAVILSAAQLEYERTLEWMETLHRELAREGVSPAEAVRRVRCSTPADEPLDAFLVGMIEVVGAGQRR